MTAHSPEGNAERLLQLSNEVGRIASALAQLSTEPPAAAQTPENSSFTDVPANRVVQLIRSRRLRASYFPEELFADPAWDMMLELFHSELTHRRVSIASLTAASAVPSTTALRWINALVEKALLLRRGDPHDGRRVFIELTPEASSAMRSYFVDMERI